MNRPSANNNATVDIEDHGVVLVRGADAAKFLQGQVTCDIQALLSSAPQRPSALGAHCTHKGRMLFTFRALFLDNSTIALIIYRALIPQVMTYLGKYIVFFKAELVDAQSDYQLLGIEGAAVTTVLREAIPDLGDGVNTVTVGDSMIAIGLGRQRYEILLNNTTLSNKPTNYRNRFLAVSQQRDVDYWTSANIQSGIGEVRPETSGEFIPQMLNLQLVGDGVSFDKGCYTGQEVVARMRYLGKLKRRMYRLRLAPGLLPHPGAAIYSTSHRQSVGTVVIAGRIENHIEVLAVVINTVIEADSAYIDEHHRRKLQLLPLPYATP